VGNKLPPPTGGGCPIVRITLCVLKHTVVGYARIVANCAIVATVTKAMIVRIKMIRFNEYDDRALIRLYRIIYRKVDSLMRGDPWGWDMPTLGVLYPDLHLALRSIIAEGKRRGL
jgi:hypothetical protein